MRKLFVFGLILLTGCMTFSRKSLPTAQLAAPVGTRVTDLNGNPLKTWVKDSITYFSTPYHFDNKVKLQYDSADAQVTLSKHIFTWMPVDILSFGAGFLLDDITQKWYSYDPIIATYDSTQRILNVTSTNWLGESSRINRISPLIMGSLTISPPLLSKNPSPWNGQYLFGVELAGGIDINKTYEIFGSKLYASEGGTSPWIISGRFFLVKNYFVELSGGVLNTDYSVVEINPSSNSLSFVPITGPNVPVFGLGTGWSGDYTFLELRFLTATSQYPNFYLETNPSSPQYYQLLSLNYGLFLRF